MQKITTIVVVVALFIITGLLASCIPGEEVIAIDPLNRMANATQKNMDKGAAAINDVSVPKPVSYIETGTIPPEVLASAINFADNGKNPNILNSKLMPYVEFAKYNFGDFIGGKPDNSISAVVLLGEFSNTNPNDKIYPVVSEYTIADDVTPRKALVIVIGTNSYPANPVEWNK